MQKEQRHRAPHRAPLVDIMDIERPMPLHLHIPRELRYLIDARLHRAPVKSAPPPRKQPPHVREGRAVRPARVLQLVRPAREVEFRVEERECIVGHGDLERLLRHLPKCVVLVLRVRGS